MHMEGFSNPLIAPAPVIDPPRQHRAKLQSQSDVCRELAKLYRECRANKLDSAVASRLANMLSILSRIMADTDLEATVEALAAEVAALSAKRAH